MGYFFSLFSPFLDSILNFLDKFLLSNYKVSNTILAIYSGVFAFITGFLVFLFIGFHAADLKTVFVLTASGFFSVFILLSYFKALSYGEASRVASLFQFVPVMVIILSFIFLKESLTVKQYFGCFFIIIFGFLLSWRSTDKGGFHINKAFWYMLLSSFLFAVVSILFKIGVKEVGFLEAIPYEGLGNAFAVLVLVLFKDNSIRLTVETKKLPKKVFFYLVLSELIYRVSRYSFYFALVLLPTAIVSVFQGFQPVFLLIEGVILTVLFPKLVTEVIDSKIILLKSVFVLGIVSGLWLLFI